MRWAGRSKQKDLHMRIALLTAAFLSMCFGAPKAELSGANIDPYIKLTQVIKNGTLRITAKNVSNKPVVAYVIAVEDGVQLTTHHDY
jgi:hypothetical protein